MRNDRSRHSCGTVVTMLGKEKVVVMGGTSKHRKVEMYDVEVDVWTEVQDLPADNYLSPHAQYGDTVVFFGALNEDYAIETYVYEVRKMLCKIIHYFLGKGLN